MVEHETICKMMYALTHHWHFLRIIRLLLGMFIAVEGGRSGDYLMLTLGLFFSGMALFNKGCCASGACNHQIENKEREKEIVYEEVHNK